MLQNSNYASTSPNGLTSSLPKHDQQANSSSAFPSMMSGYDDSTRFLEDSLQQLSYGFPPAAFQTSGGSSFTNNGGQHDIALSPSNNRAALLPSLTNSSVVDYTGNPSSQFWGSLQTGPDHSSQQHQSHNSLYSRYGNNLLSSTGVMRVEDVYKKINRPHVRSPWSESVIIR